MSGFPVTKQSSSAILGNILNDVGANKVNVGTTFRDSLTQAAIYDTANGTGSVILPRPATVTWPTLSTGTAPTDTDNDGMPDAWETSKGLNPNNAVDGNNIAASGYTNLEIYLAGTGSETTPPPPPPPPPPTSLPDVVVTTLSYANGFFTSTVKNQGTAPTPSGVAIGVGYSVDGIHKTWGAVNGPLAPGASVTIGTNGGAYTIPAGTHPIKAYVDDVNRIAESNETNNQLAR
jgi:hypothetical protein